MLVGMATAPRSSNTATNSSSCLRQNFRSQADCGSAAASVAAADFVWFVLPPASAAAKWMRIRKLDRDAQSSHSGALACRLLRSNSPLTIEFLERNTTINAVRYVASLTKS